MIPEMNCFPARFGFILWLVKVFAQLKAWFAGPAAGFDAPASAEIVVPPAPGSPSPPEETGTNSAFTDCDSPISTAQAPMPEQAPDQPAKREPDAGVAEKT